MKFKPTNFKIIVQGGPVVNSIHVIKQFRDVAVLAGDMESKWCEYSGHVSYGCKNRGPAILINHNKRSLYLFPRKKHYTEVELIDFVGWKIWCVEVNRYSIYACLIKEE